MERPKSSKQSLKKMKSDLCEQDINKDHYKSYYLTEFQKDNNIKLKRNYSIEEDSINEQLNLLKNEWDELGVTLEYRNNFIKSIKDIPKSGKKNIIIHEINNLKNFALSLINLKKEILNRENNLALLNQYNNSLGNIFNKEDLINDILQEIVNIIKKLRKNAINIASKILKLNKVMDTYLDSGKIDIKKMKKEYIYDKNYLNKMKDDLLYLKDSAISRYIEMNNSKIDAFLTNCTSNPNNFIYNNKITIPIPEDHMNIIKDLRYLLLQEELTYNSNVKSEKLINGYNNIEENNLNNVIYRNNNYSYKAFKGGISLNNKNKSFISNSVKKIKKKALLNRELNISYQKKALKNKFGKDNYENLFLNRKKNFHINLNGHSNKDKIGKSNIFKLFPHLNKNKIRIEREEIKSLTNNEFINNLNKYETEYNYSYYFENKKDQMNTDDILKDYYKQSNEEIELIKIRNWAENEEKNRIKLEKDVDNLQLKLKEKTQSARELEKELKKMNIKRKQKERELKDKIEDLEKNEKLKIENEFKEKIKNLEEKLKNEENLRKNREKEIEEMKIKMKEDEEKRIQEEEKIKKEEEEKKKQNEIIQKMMEEKRKIEESNNLKMFEEQKKTFEQEKERMLEEIKKQENLVKEMDEEKTKFENEKNKIENDYNLLKEEKKNLENDYNNLKEEKENIENNYNKFNEEKIKLENDYNTLTEEKNNLEKKLMNAIEENKDLKKQVEEVSKGIIRNHNFVPVPTSTNYKIDFFRGNISNLLNIIVEKISLEAIPEFLQRAFMLDDTIYNEEYYFKGTFPKIILSTKGRDENNIKGLCFLFYESNTNLSENLILRINSIFAIEDYESQIILMIDFIKKKMNFKRLEIFLLYDKIEDKFIPNEEAVKIFQKRLGFKWLCVVRDEKLNQRYIKLYFNKENEIEEKKEDDIPNNYNNFNMESLTIITVNDGDNAYLLNNIINNRSKSNLLFRPYYNKYISLNPIYSLLCENSKLDKQLLNKSKLNELKDNNSILWRFTTAEHSWNAKEEKKRHIKNISFKIENSIYKQIENYFTAKSTQCLCDLYKQNLSINFQSNHTIVFDNIYYNKITTDKIKVLKEKLTKSLFFLIPSTDNTVLFYIGAANKKLKDILFDNEINIYDKFLEFQPNNQKDLLEFSSNSYRDISYLPQVIENTQKTLYLPTFSIDTHLFSYKLKDIEKKIKMAEQDTNKPLILTSVDEYINVKFKPDENIENSFSIVPVDDRKNNIIIQSSFIIGIFGNDITNNNKLPLLQFLYVTKNHFLTRQNYKPKSEISII